MILILEMLSTTLVLIILFNLIDKFYLAQSIAHFFLVLTILNLL